MKIQFNDQSAQAQVSPHTHCNVCRNLSVHWRENSQTLNHFTHQIHLVVDPIIPSEIYTHIQRIRVCLRETTSERGKYSPETSEELYSYYHYPIVNRQGSEARGVFTSWTVGIRPFRKIRILMGCRCLSVQQWPKGFRLVSIHSFLSKDYLTAWRPFQSGDILLRSIRNNKLESHSSSPGASVRS